MHHVRDQVAVLLLQLHLDSRTIVKLGVLIKASTTAFSLLQLEGCLVISTLKKAIVMAFRRLVFFFGSHNVCRLMTMVSGEVRLQLLPSVCHMIPGKYLYHVAD